MNVDILTHTVVWLINGATELLLRAGRWVGKAFVWALDWGSEKVLAALQVFSQAIEWGIQNPWNAVKNVGMAILAGLLVLAAGIYIFDLAMRRRPRREL